MGGRAHGLREDPNDLRPLLEIVTQRTRKNLQQANSGCHTDEGAQKYERIAVERDVSMARASAVREAGMSGGFKMNMPLSQHHPRLPSSNSSARQRWEETSPLQERQHGEATTTINLHL
jgi:hypothetical protein